MNKNFTVITVESPNDDLRRKYRDHPTLPAFIESILLKPECIFFPRFRYPRIHINIQLLVSSPPFRIRKNLIK